MKSYLIFMIYVFLHISSIYAKSDDFFEERNRGWQWFEEIEKKKLKQKATDEKLKKEIEAAKYAKARKEVEAFAARLEELKFMMIRHPRNVEHAKAYKEQEAIMMDNAIILANTSRMVNFMNPLTHDLIDNPTNLFGKRIKEEIDAKASDKEIKRLATEIELFFFFSSNCPYCMSLEPILNDFAKKFGFKIEAVSLDGTVSKYFKTHQDSGLAKALNLERTPTIVAVTNDSSKRFELIRGMASFSELEDACLMAIQYLRENK